MLSNGEYIVPNALSHQQMQQIAMSSSHSTNWRGMISNSEVKESASTRAYSAAVKALRPKGVSSTNPQGGAQIIIPKVSLKKKSNGQNGINVQSLLGMKNSANGGAAANFRTIQGKQSSTQATSKSHVIMDSRKSQQFQTNPSTMT